MSIGERITQLRTEKQISQGQLADMLGVTRQAVSKWENDQTSPDTIRLIKLADALDTEVEYLATGRKPVYEQPIVLNMVKKEDRIVEKVIEKPVIKKLVRIKYRRNPVEYAVLAVCCLFAGIVIGLLL